MEFSGLTISGLTISGAKPADGTRVRFIRSARETGQGPQSSLSSSLSVEVASCNVFNTLDSGWYGVVVGGVASNLVVAPYKCNPSLPCIAFGSVGKGLPVSSADSGLVRQGLFAGFECGLALNDASNGEIVWVLLE